MKKICYPTVVREATIIFLIVVIGYGYFSFEADWNSNSRLALVKAFVDEGRFEIDSYHNSELYTNDKSYFNGHYYSDKAIGTALLGVFVYYPIRWIYQYADIVLTTDLFRQWLTFFVVSVPTALLAPFLYMFIKQITKNAMKALITALAVTLGMPLYKHGTGFYGHTLEATFFFGAFLIWFNFRRHQFVTLPLAGLSAFLLGFMVITEYPTAVLILFLSFYILHTLYQSRQLFNWKVYGIMAAGFLAPVCIQLYYNTMIFGTPLMTGYSYESQQLFKSAHAIGFIGFGWPNLSALFYQTFHPSIGIFWQSPVLFLSLIGWFFMSKNEDYRAEMYFTVGAIVLYILFFSGFYGGWIGGLVFTPRYLIPILPLFAVPLAFLPESFSIPLLIVGIISIFQNLVMTASGYDGLAAFFQNSTKTGIFQYKGILVYKVCLPNLINDRLTDNRGLQIMHLRGALSLLPLLLPEFILLTVCRKLTYSENSVFQKRHTAPIQE